MTFVQPFRSVISDSGTSLLGGPLDSVDPLAKAAGAVGPDQQVRQEFLSREAGPFNPGRSERAAPPGKPKTELERLPCRLQSATFVLVRLPMSGGSIPKRGVPSGGGGEDER